MCKYPLGSGGKRKRKCFGDKPDFISSSIMCSIKFSGRSDINRVLSKILKADL